MSSWHTSQLSYAFGLSGLMSFYGIVGLIVWFAGDKYGYDTTYRIVVIAIVLLTLPFALIIGFVSARRAKKREAAEAAALEAESAAAAGEPVAGQRNLQAPAGGFDELNQSTEEVVQFLKSSNLGAGKDAVFSLPWYVVAGSPNSGKTALVLSSGLNFQTLPSQRQSESRTIRPTRNIDWRVTSDAVFLDTAGKYQTENGHDEEWAALIETIKKYRAQRPLDGMLLTINAETILNANEHEIEQIAKVFRARLDEVIQRTKLRFPVYLVFTNADVIEGFRDSFSTSKREGENLVWGATIPLEKAENAQALFDSEFDLLQSSVMKRRLMRLSAPFPPVRQLKIFNFPLHFGAARKKFGHFIATLFRPNPFSENPLMRGFYFTAVPENTLSVAGTPASADRTVGQGYFTEKFFKEVVLRDKDLVATFQAQKVGRPIMGWLLTTLGALLTGALLLVSGTSLYKNRQMLDEASNQGEAVMKMVKVDAGRNPLTKSPEESRAELDTTDDLRKTLVDLDNYERNGAPILMRFGLYSGNRIYREKLLPTYFNAIEQRFKRPTVNRLEGDLRKFASSQAVANTAQLTAQEEDNLGKHYDLLKAYLMLSDDYRERVEPTFLTSTLSDIWKSESKLPPGSETAAQQQLEFYARQIDRDEFPRIKLDSKLVDDARKKLQAFPAVFRYYKRVTTEISKKVDPVSVDSVLAGRSAGVVDGSYTVPGAFTIDGYRKHMKEAISKAEQELTKDDWVMGEKAEKAQSQGADIQRLQDKYFNDYTDNWRKFIRGVNVPPYKNKEEAVNALKAFSNTESPMAILVKEVSRHTNLSAKPKTTGWWDWLMSFFEKAQTTENTGDSIVEKEFRPLFGFSGEEGKTENSPISQYGADIKRLSEALETKSEDQIKQITKDLEGEKDTIGLRKAETAINNKVEAFGATSAGQEIAELLKKPITNLKAFFGRDAQSQIGKAWLDQILPKAREAERGYPFEDSATETDLTRLTAYLNPVNGTLSKFYTERLEKYFEEANGQLRVKETSEVKFSPEFVTYLNNAFRLREALYGKNASAAFEYDFKLMPVKDSVIEVKIDGQTVTSAGTSSIKFKFPAGSATETGAFLNFASTAEASSASGNPLPAATPSGTSPASNTNPALNFLQSSDNTAGSSQIKFPGTWGLFRFFEAGAPKKSPSGEYILTYKLGGKTVTATVRPSGGDLFNRALFTSAKAPQTFLRQ